MRVDRKHKVCILTSAHKPFDDRIFHKQAITLAGAGYDVSLIAKHDRDEVVSGVRILNVLHSGGRLARMTSMQTKILARALKENADLYHFHDPELIVVGLILKMRGSKVIYDVHELVYHQIENKNWIRSRMLKKAAQFAYRLFEGLSVRFFDRLVLAEDDYINYFKRAYGDSGSYSVIRNSPVLSLIEGAVPIIPNKNGRFVVIYAGGLSRDRGIREIIESMRYVGGRAELHLLGEWDGADFMMECEKLEGWARTRYLGFRPLTEVYGCMKGADIGISVLYPIKNYLTSLPVKVFEYMTCSLPMIISDFPCWRGIFGECAFFVDPTDPRDIAEKITHILDNPEKAAEMVRKGNALIKDEYNWDLESQKLTALYGHLLNEG